MEPKDRLAQIAQLEQGLQAAWPTLLAHLQSRRSELVVALVAHEDEQMRGRIKELDDLLSLPQRLQQEAQGLAAPQEEGELP